MAGAATIIYHVTIILSLDWSTMSATPSDILQPTSIMLEISETISVLQPHPSSVLDTSMLTASLLMSTSLLMPTSLLMSTTLETPIQETPVQETSVQETPVQETSVQETPVQETPMKETPIQETPVQSTCFIGGRTVIKEDHSVASNNTLFLQYIKSSNCPLSKRTFGMKICYRSSSNIFIEGSLWTKTQTTYVKFTTLVQTSLPVSLNETCKSINVSDISFMKNTFFGIALINSTNDSGIVLNPTEVSNWCIAEGYETNANAVDKTDCTALDSDVGVAALFYPAAETDSSDKVDSIEAGAIVGIVMGSLIFIFVTFILLFVMAYYWKLKNRSYIVSKKSDDGVDKIEIFKLNHFTSDATLWNNSTDDSKNVSETSNQHTNGTPVANGVQTYERPVAVQEGVALHFTNPSFFSMNDSPSRVVSCVHDEPIFDQPSDDCAPVDMHVTAKKRDLWKNKKLHGCLYEKPAGDVRTLIRQLKKPEIKKIKRIDISKVKELGSGAFGLVSLAVWEDKQVAVKTLNSEATEKEKIKLLQEAALMGQFIHENVIRLFAVITEEPIGMVMEFASKGDLHKFLIELKPDIMEGELIPDTVPLLLLQFARQVAAGMHYLSSKFFVHRDLAARNILITEDLVCKIADFGMSRDLEDENFYVVSGGKIPVKWTAPEALYFRKYTTLSDVWSFGCVLYEMWSLGSRPFEDITAKDALVKISEGYRLPPPPGCPKLMYKLMIRCWHPDPESRPIFALIIKYLNKPDEELLNISEEDRDISGTRASTLGYPLSDGINLYKDLQVVYSNADSN